MTRSWLTYLFILGHIVFYAQKNSDLDHFDEKLREYRYSKHLDSSHIYFKKGLEIALQKKDSIAVFYLYKKLGDAYEHHQFIDSTLMMYDICDSYIPKGNYKLRSFLLNDKAYTYQLLYDYDKSAELTLEALKWAELSKDKREIASVSVSLADGFSNLGMNKQAEFYYMYAIKYAQFGRDTGMLSYAHRYYGVHLISNKNFSMGYLNLKEAERFSTHLKDSISMAFVWHHIADYYWEVKQPDSSFYYAKKAESIWERRAEYIDVSAACLQQARYYVSLKNYAEAEKYLLKSEKYSREDMYFNEKLYSAMADLYNKKGDSKRAFAYLSKAKNLGELIKEKESKAKLMSLRIKFETDQKEGLIQKEKQKNEAISQDAQNKTAQRNTIFLVLVFFIVSLGISMFAYFKIRRKNELLHQSNVKLENLALQKQTLLREVHHRVKNNLTTLKSLFYLQAKSSKTNEVKSVLEECQQRIQSMALIHQNLYEDSESGKIEFQYFLKQLFNEVELSIKPSDKDISIEYKGANIELDMSVALFLGLIINELATNSCKYAFVNRTEGNMGIELRKAASMLTVIYFDDGIGLPSDYQSMTGGFGFKLIRILTEQINASFNYEKVDNRSEFKIEIPLEQ